MGGGGERWRAVGEIVGTAERQQRGWGWGRRRVMQEGVQERTVQRILKWKREEAYTSVRGRGEEEWEKER